MPVPNYEKIDNLRKFDGFGDLIEHFRKEAQVALDNAVTSADDRVRLRGLTEYETYKRVISFLTRKTFVDKS